MELLEILEDTQAPVTAPEILEAVQRPLKPLPMPDGRPVPCFFGRRFLTFHDLIEIGFVSNAMTLRRLIAEGRFPPPLELGRRIRLWDALELHAFVERLAAARAASPQKEEAAETSAAETCLTPLAAASQQGLQDDALFEIPTPRKSG